MRELRGIAPAKLNLVLEVTGRRADGYHELTTVMQTLDIADRVTLHPGGGGGMEVAGPFADGVPADTTNLAWRAAAHLAGATGNDVSQLGIRLEKHIPPAAGLGGGASDAATVLKLLQQAWDVGDTHLAEAANAVGSDEAFFLEGGTALVRGRGERVEILQPLPPHGVVLFVPRATLPAKTAHLFDALARLPYDDGSAVETFTARHPRSIRTTDCFNAFERVAEAEFPGLEKLRSALERDTGERLLLAGAGPTLAWIGPPGDAERLAARASGHDCSVLVTRTTERQWGQ